MIWRHFAIPVFTQFPKIRPDLMLIGGQSLWFDRVDMTLAVNICLGDRKWRPRSLHIL